MMMMMTWGMQLLFLIVGGGHGLVIGSSPPQTKVVSLAKEFIEKASGIYGPLDDEMYSEDFVFRGGMIGPLNKKDYLATMRWLGVADAFELEANAFGFTVDPQNPNCVRYFVRNTGEHVGGFLNGALQPRDGYRKINGPLETAQIIFDDAGKVKFLTAGNVVASKMELEETNTGGLGAIVGLMHAVGYPLLAKGGSYPFVRNFNTGASRLLDTFDLVGALPKTSSVSLPEWYKAN